MHNMRNTVLSSLDDKSVQTPPAPLGRLRAFARGLNGPSNFVHLMNQNWYKIVLFAALLTISVPAFAKKNNGEAEIFSNAARISGKIDAMNSVCPKKGDTLDDKDNAKEKLKINRDMTMDLLDSYKERGASQEEQTELQEISDEAYSKKLKELKSREKIECGLSDILWEKQALYKNLLIQLKKINGHEVEPEPAPMPLELPDNIPL